VQAVLPAVPYSCRQGFCGTCHVRLLAGRTERDTSAPGSMALCVARAEGDRVVLDL
jgi:ferredoxin